MTAQIRCGVLKAMKGKASVEFRGRVTLDGRFDDVLVLRKHPRAKNEDGSVNENAPSYEIFFERNARELAAGAAWIKNSEKIEGGDFLSLTLDSIRWPRPVYLTAFPPSKGDPDSWPVVWSRPRGARVQDETFDELEDSAQEN